MSLGSSNLVIGTSTVPLTSNRPVPAEFSVGGQTFVANPPGFSVDGKSLLPNGPAVTLSGTPVSLGASVVVIGTKTIALPSDPSLPVFTVAGSTFTANPTGFSIVDTTLVPNGAPVTISGTLISLGTADQVVGALTVGLPAVPFVLTANGQRFTANTSGFSAGTEIHQGGSPITISGTPILLGSSAILVGSNTVSLSVVNDRLGPAILSGFGFTTAPTVAAGARNNSELFLGAQIRMEVPLVLLISCFCLTVLIRAGFDDR